jgi:hypothetical protein
VAKGAPKGHPKWGGKKKGTPNKDKQRVLDLCKQYGGKEPVEVLAIELNCGVPERAVWAADKLMPYCYPKLSSVVLAEDPANPFGEISENKFLDKIKELHVAAAKERKGG